MDPLISADHDADARPRRAAPGTATWRDRVMAVGAVAGLGAACVLLGYQLFGGPPSAAQLSRMRVVIDSETSEVIREFVVPDNEDLPFRNPRSGKRTLYFAEQCYWNKDGTAKLSPTYVLLNAYVGKEGPTLCPDCGRTVVGHNPMPPADLLLKAAEREGKLKPEAPPPAAKK